MTVELLTDAELTDLAARFAWENERQHAGAKLLRAYEALVAERDAYKQAADIEAAGKESMRSALAAEKAECARLLAVAREANTRLELLEEIADGVVDMLDGEPSGSDSLDWALRRYGYTPTKGVDAP